MGLFGLSGLWAQLVTPHPETETGGARQGAQQKAARPMFQLYCPG
jgi:hypothetical protein